MRGKWPTLTADSVRIRPRACPRELVVVGDILLTGRLAEEAPAITWAG